MAMAQLEIYKYLLFVLSPLYHRTRLDVLHLVHFQVLQNSSVLCQPPIHYLRKLVPIMLLGVVLLSETLYA